MLRSGQLYTYVSLIVKLIDYLPNKHMLVECVENRGDVVIGYYNALTHTATGICYQSAMHSDENINQQNLHIDLPENRYARCNNKEGLVSVGFRYFVDRNVFFSSYKSIKQPNIWLDLEERLTECQCL